MSQTASLRGASRGITYMSHNLHVYMKETALEELTGVVVDIVRIVILAAHFLPAKRQLVARAVGKSLGFRHSGIK